MDRRSKIRRLTRNDLIQLIDQQGEELLNKLNQTNFGFGSFLMSRGYWSGKSDDFELLVMTVQIVSEAWCGRRGEASLRKFLRMLKECKDFLYNDVPRAINMCLYERRPNVNIIMLISQYISILREIMRYYPCERIVDEVYPALENSMNFVKEKRIRNLEVASQQFSRLCVEVEKYQKLHTENEDDKDLVENFRKLSVVPRNDDIINCEIPGLSQNIIDQPYDSVTHYLSVHFRLMREDMLRSFRGITKTFHQTHSFRDDGKNRFYEKAFVDHPPKYTMNGICYNVKVTTSKKLDFSKKGILTPGSLVCFTADSFHSVVFATIVQNPRATSNISQECQLKVKLEDDLCRDELKSGIAYLMIEPSAYFEGYRHVLSALKEFSENNFPLSDIITYLDYENPEPEYLQSLQYCLHEQCSSCATQEQLFSKNDKSHPCKIFDPLLHEAWPMANELDLDEQQLEAFKCALTKKVAVIQGPPGTGKTYIGVKVVKALLDNVPHKPIIVSCLTNHALDQFIERILKHTKKVVRLGSQSKKETLEPYNLQNMIFALQKFHEYSADPSVSVKVDKNMEKSLDLIKSICPAMLKEKLLKSYDDDTSNLIHLCRLLNKELNTYMLCRDKYLSDTALNEIISSDGKRQLLKGSGTNSDILSTSVFEWLCCSRSSDLYEKCKKQFRRIKQQTDFTDRDLNEEDLWSLTEYERFELFYFWRAICLEICEKNIKDQTEEYKILLPRCSQRVTDPMKLEILRNADIIGVTTTGAAKYRDLIKYCEPRIVIVEEAAQALEAQVIATLTFSTRHLILIGDHEQLRPIPTDHDLSENYNLKISLFERLFMNNAPSATLVTQHRMKPCIADLLVPKPYEVLNSAESVYKYDEIKGVLSSVFFLDHSEPEDTTSSGTSASNKHEARLIVSLAKYFLSLSYDSSKITILATYAAQVQLIFQYLEEEKLMVQTTTVDNYQGEENDIILVSFVRSSTTIGYLKESNRVCVALSRARKGLFCIGNFTLYASKNQLWNTIIQKLSTKNMVGETLCVKCRQHGKSHSVKTANDISKFLNRGCGENCNYVLPCGHTCNQKCHFIDSDHIKYLCKMPCTKYIDEMRICPRMCFERCKKPKVPKVELPCGHVTKKYMFSDSSLSDVKCEEEMQKRLPCGHLVTIPCYFSVFTYQCRALVPIDLPCGHRKNILCHQQSELKDVICTEMRPEVGPCGHIIDVPCSLKLLESELLAFCTRPCDALLSCGHPCVGHCRWCFDIGIHFNCTSRCELKLSCSHQCEGCCGSPCIPCKQKCFLSCPHSKICANFCSRPCMKCQKPCARRCNHTCCTKLCYEKCDVKPCEEACHEILPCGHECIGLCGDPCPYLCRICHADELNFGDLRYIILEDCDHVIEVNKMDVHVEECLEALDWPSCPECSQAITKSGRYKNQLQRAKNFCLQSNEMTEELAEVRYFLNAMYYSKDYLIPARFLDIHCKITQILDIDRPNSASLLILKHCVKCLSKLLPVSSRLEKNAESNFDLSLENRLDTLLLWICSHLTMASFQQLRELESAVSDLYELVLGEFHTSSNIPNS